MSLAPYTGDFGRRKAAHLLRRCTFGVTPERITEAVRLGLPATLDRLLAAETPIAPPINLGFSDDPNVPVGQTWVQAPFVAGVDVNSYREASLRTWQIESYLTGGFTLAPRMSLFWHNHFSVNSQIDSRAYYNYLQLLRTQALGNFKSLVATVTIEPAMLRFLNGDVNVVDHPNENYARELLELFTIGKGPQAGPGDYTNYTESDVRAISNVLTGWRPRYLYSEEMGKLPTSRFREHLHDPTPQQLSSRLGSQVVGGTGAGAYLQVIDALFASPAAARYMVTKLYRYFVHYELSDEISANILRPLAVKMYGDEYNISGALRMLLGSQHFFAEAQQGALVKSPLDFIGDFFGPLHFPIPTQLHLRGDLWEYIGWEAGKQSMLLTAPPSVAGYEAYHQAPLYNRIWINAATLALRTHLSKLLLMYAIPTDEGDLVVDVLALAAAQANPSDPNELVSDLVEMLIHERPDAAQIATFKEVLIPGLPDFEWTVEYSAYLDAPNNEDNRRSIRRKLEDVLVAITSAPEFQLY